MVIGAMQAFAVGLETALGFEHVLDCPGIDGSLDPAQFAPLSNSAPSTVRVSTDNTVQS